MKNLYKVFLAVTIFTFDINSGAAQIPTYTLTAMNFVFDSLNNPDDAIEFDIYLLHTNPDVTEFFFGSGQYYFSFNPEILTVPIPPNINDTSQVSYKIIGSNLPPNWQPRFPSISTATNPAASILRLAINTFPTGQEPQISHDYPGTKIVRVRLWNKTAPLNNVPLNLQWRNPPIITSATKIFAYVGISNTNITTPETHYINKITNISSPVSLEIPDKFELSQNYPNPFNPKTIIDYQLSMFNFVSIKLYNISGREVATLVNQKQEAGYYSIEFDASNLSSGVYFYNLNAGSFKMTKKMMILK